MKPEHYTEVQFAEGVDAKPTGEVIDGWRINVGFGRVRARKEAKEYLVTAQQLLAMVWVPGDLFEHGPKYPCVDAAHAPVTVVTRMLELWREMQEEK